ncbi:hypothetical protein [Actinocatenispora rupis]|uniref:Uncharacterized protein n=1 Tax=Actinocatenispora rupis TaxID=519421 RepID=A0A8J3NAQ4_9ACTN|nr:hypothetical protein [Actinocatenispora rupis]GID09935.1 hypothetical protein Aru02nite_08240 [Actinocatenispora rupis]
MAAKALLNSLTEAESALLRETERDRIAGLDEDALIELHQRIRRARDKFVSQYRRTAAERVEKYAARGTARPKNRRNADKAELFEDALARVSRALAAAARRSATALRTERLAAARSVRHSGPARTAPAPRPSRARPQRTDRRPTQPVLRKQRASTRAKGARRQARKDAT